MLYYHTENANFGIFWIALECKMLVFFIAICFYLNFGTFFTWLVGIFLAILVYFYHILVCCAKKTLATPIHRNEWLAKA
jgi:hypothetical protein